MRIDFFPLHPDAFGLDLSDLSLKIAKLQRTKKGTELVSFGDFLIPAGLIEQGEIKKQKELKRILSASLQKVQGKKLSTKYVVVSLPEEQAFLQVVQLPHMQEEEVRSALNFEIENYIPYSPETVYFDSSIVKPMIDHRDHIDVLLVALPRKTIDSYTALFKEVGLIPVAFETESLALSRALIAKEMSEFPVLIIDLEETRTNFIIFAGFSVRFAASISIPSSASLTNDLVLQIKKYNDYYEEHADHQHLPGQNRSVKKILLTGGGANVAGLASFLKHELAIETVLGNPWVNIFQESLSGLPPIPFSTAIRYSAALGLALRGLQST